MQALDPINGPDFQRLSEIRLREASTLLAAGQYEGVYYLVGYAAVADPTHGVLQWIRQYW
jgi:hypothetical protein